MHFFAEALTDDVIISTSDEVVHITTHTPDGSRTTRVVGISVVDGKIAVTHDFRPDTDSIDDLADVFRL